MLIGILSRKASIKVAVVHFCGTNKNFSYKYVFVTSNDGTVSNYVQVAVAGYKIISSICWLRLYQIHQKKKKAVQ